MEQSNSLFFWREASLRAFLASLFFIFISEKDINFRIWFRSRSLFHIPICRFIFSSLRRNFGLKKRFRMQILFRPRGRKGRQLGDAEWLFWVRKLTITQFSSAEIKTNLNKKCQNWQKFKSSIDLEKFTQFCEFFAIL